MTLCTGQCSGTATTTLSGGMPPYTIVWSDSAAQSTQTAVNLCTGTYNVTITDGNGCTATPNPGVFVPDFPDPFVCVVTVSGAGACKGWAGGSALLTYSGGTPPYQIFWSNGLTTDTATNLNAGTYTVTGTDAHGCIVISTVVIPDKPPISGNIAVVNAACGVCNGTATVTPSGGNGTYTYQWVTTPVQTTQTATGFCDGIYALIIEDGAVPGCRDTLIFTVNENGSQPFTVSTTDASCYNICDGTATVNLTGGCLNPPCGFLWIDSTWTSIGQTTASVVNLCATDYYVAVSNSLGCTSYGTAAIDVANPLFATLAVAQVSP